MTIMTYARWAAALAAALIVTAQQPSAYVPKAYKWGTLQVPFYVNPQNLHVSQAAAIAAVQTGAYAWTNQSTTAFSFYYAGTTAGVTVSNNGRNEVFFRNASNGTNIATTYTYSSGSRILDTDIVFWDGAYKFFTGNSGCSKGFYIEDIATHEFGHALGLGHSTVSNATMVSGAKYCAIDHRYLADDDIQGVEFLYPSGPTNTAPTVAVTSPAAGASFTEGASVSFSGSASDKEDGNLGSSLVWVSSRDGQVGTGTAFQRVLSVGTHTITARVTDSKGLSAETTRTVTVEPAPVAAPPSGGFIATGSAYKVKGVQSADLTWTGATSSSIDVRRNGVKIATIGNTGTYTDAINQKGGGTYRYVLCEAGTSICSNEVTVSF